MEKFKTMCWIKRKLRGDEKNWAFVPEIIQVQLGKFFPLWPVIISLVALFLILVASSWASFPPLISYPALYFPWPWAVLIHFNYHWPYFSLSPASHWTAYFTTLLHLNVSLGPQYIQNWIHFTLKPALLLACPIHLGPLVKTLGVTDK